MMKSNEFKDAKQDTWSCRVSTPFLIKVGRHLNLSISDLSDPMKASIDKWIGMIWFSVEDLAKARGVTKEEFETKRLTPLEIQPAITAFMAAFTEAFPNKEDVGNESPLEAAPENPANGE